MENKLRDGEGEGGRERGRKMKETPYMTDDGDWDWSTASTCPGRPGPPECTRGHALPVVVPRASPCRCFAFSFSLRKWKRSRISCLSHPGSCALVWQLGEMNGTAYVWLLV